MKDFATWMEQGEAKSDGKRLVGRRLKQPLTKQWVAQVAKDHPDLDDFEVDLGLEGEPRLVMAGWKSTPTAVMADFEGDKLVKLQAWELVIADDLTNARTKNRPVHKTAKAFLNDLLD